MAGTLITEEVEANPENIPTIPLYEGTARSGEIAWTATQQPAGSAATRYGRSLNGHSFVVHGIALPILTDRLDCKTLINFSNLQKVKKDLDFNDRIIALETIGQVQWINLGKGIPLLF